MIIDCLSSEERKLLRLLTYKEGEILFYENDVCDSIGIVISGEIRISSLTFEGNEVIYNLLTKGNIFGNNLIFSNDNHYRGNVKAVSKGSLYLISKDNLIKILMNNKDFLLEYLSIHSEFTKGLNTKLKLLTFNNAKERFMYYLFVNNNHIKFKNITSLAHELYLSREATSRLISQLEKEDKLIKSKHDIYLKD